MEVRAVLIGLLAFTVFHAQCLHLDLDTALARDKAAKQKAEDALDPEQRKAAHAEAFEKEFIVELNMTEAHDDGKSVGVQLDTDTDFTEVSVMKIKKNGLLQEWNDANPDKAVHLGDQIIRVNDILWHHNSQTFAERIKNQFKAAREYKEGAKRILTLYLQRPRKAPEVRYQSQREDLHRQMYSKDFTVEIPLLRNSTMGWDLNVTKDWEPITVRTISSGGLVDMWNKENPESRIYPGDEILQANQIVWHHNSKLFNTRIKKQFSSLVEMALPNGPKTNLTLKLQRPRSVVETLEGRYFSKMFQVNLSWTNASQPLGWTLQTNTTDPVNVTTISDHSIISLWNRANPGQRLAPGDRILKANKANWHKNKSNFANNLRKFVDTARHAPTGAQQNITLWVQRQAQVSYTRGWLVEIPAKVGTNLGLQVNATDDELPVTINKIRALGAVATFNEDSPEEAVVPGDHIFKVNEILWRHDSKEFAKRLDGQFTRSKRTGKMLLWVQRPEGLEGDEVDPNMDYLDYSVELPVPSPKAIGWELKADNESTPISVSKILKQGSIRVWNDGNPLKDIQLGDEIVQVDNNVWRNNTKFFMQRLTKQVSDASQGIGKKSISVLFRRRYATSNGNVENNETEQEKIGEGDVMGAEE